jgi:acetyl-CoA carboxylase biotin carboxyl carrier protein|tara:strand:+ start:351 stop:794 length:444 start_codon:yes stop_codon:yes gene_type:complete
MKIKKIKNLIKFIKDLNINEITIETKKIKIIFKENKKESNKEYKKENNKEDEEENNKENDRKKTTCKKYLKIKSPIIGTFYSSKNPKEKPFVKEGDKIKKGEILCIIESMKIFNEIESEFDVKIIKVLAKNLSSIEYNQEMFLVQLL